MKITRVEPILIEVPYEHGGPKQMRPLGPWTRMETLFVRVDTDAGLTGWGEGFGFAASPLTREAVTRVVAPLCVGREVADVPSFMADLQRKLHAMGRHGPVSFALAGIDIALWDIAGKAQGVPLHRLLGGATRDRIPTYASLLRYGKPDLVARYTEEAIGRGYTSIKLHEHRVETVAPARKAAGPDIASWWTPIARGRRMKPSRWRGSLRSTIWPGSRSRSIRPTITTRWRASAATPASPLRPAKTSAIPAKRAMRSNAARSISFSRASPRSAALSRWAKPSPIAQQHGVRVMPHSPYFGPGLIATLHVIAACLPDSMCERFYRELEATPLGDAIAAPRRPHAGAARPGLGIDLDEDSSPAIASV